MKALRVPWWQITTVSALGSNSPNLVSISRIGTSVEPSIRAVSYSQGSRTSSSTGRVPASNRLFNSFTVMLL